MEVKFNITTCADAEDLAELFRIRADLLARRGKVEYLASVHYERAAQCWDAGSCISIGHKRGERYERAAQECRDLAKKMRDEHDARYKVSSAV